MKIERGNGESRSHVEERSTAAIGNNNALRIRERESDSVFFAFCENPADPFTRLT